LQIEEGQKAECAIVRRGGCQIRDLQFAILNLQFSILRDVE
jgi:hypothetical protein